MTSSLRPVSVGELIGSWPIVPRIGGSGPTLLPGTVFSQASILGVRQEPGLGFAVGTKSFRLYVDSTVSYTTISFSAGNKTLAAVITAINSAVGFDVAFNDNKFLRLKSPTAGGVSYLRVASGSTGSDVLYELGLMPETVVKAGDLVPAGHPDPVRQVSMPGQLTLAEGEAFSTKAINRALFQLAVNSERSENLLSKKRIAVQEGLSVTYTSPGTPEGYQFTGGTYVYTGAGTTPTVDELEKYFVVLDADGREFTKEMERVLNADTCNFVPDTQTGKQKVIGPTSFFSSSDDSGDYYVRSSAGSLPVSLRGQLLKISSVAATVPFGTTATVEPIVPSTGQVITFTAPLVLTEKVRIDVNRCCVEKITKTHVDTTRVEGLEEFRYGTVLTSSARVELNNRLIIPGAGFNILTPAVAPGDLLDWSGHAVTNPFSNNGLYRVLQVVDDQTLELAGLDWGPIYLNPDLYSAVPGTISIGTDGSFWKDPFISFLPSASGGAIPESGVDEITILYLGASTLRDASDDPVKLSGGLKYNQEADETVQKAILGIIGPSATTIDTYLQDDRRNNLEDLAYRIEQEHYRHDEIMSGSGTALGPVHVGRHRSIRPDIINMFPYTTGETVSIRTPSGEADSTRKVGFYNQASQLGAGIQADGSVKIYLATAPTSLTTFDYQGASSSVATSASSRFIANNTSTGVSLLRAQTSGGTASIEAIANGVSTGAILDADSNGAGGYALIRATSPGNTTILATSVGAESAILAQTSGVAAQAFLKLESFGTDGQSISRLYAASNSNSTAIGDAVGASILQFLGNVGATPRQFNFSLRPGTTVPTFRLDCVSTSKPLMKWYSDGRVSLGNIEPVNATFTIFGDSAASAYSYGGQTLHPEVVARSDDGGGSGFLWQANNNDLEAQGNQDAAFLAAFMFNDAGANDSRAWKAFKLMTESTLTERFSINKYGEGFFGGVGGGTPVNSDTFFLADRSAKLYVNRGIVAGDFAGADALPWISSDNLDLAKIVMVGPSNISAWEMGATNDDTVSFVSNALFKVGVGWYRAYANSWPMMMRFDSVNDRISFSASASKTGTAGALFGFGDILDVIATLDPAIHVHGPMVLDTRTQTNEPATGTNGKVYVNDDTDQINHYSVALGRYQALDNVVFNHYTGDSDQIHAHTHDPEYFTDNAGAVELSYTIPANTLRDGTVIEIVTWGSHTNTVNNYIPRLSLGISIYSFAMIEVFVSSGNSSDWLSTIRIVCDRTGNTMRIEHSLEIGLGATTAGSKRMVLDTVGVTMSGSVKIGLKGEFEDAGTGTADYIFVRGGYIKVY